MDIFVTWENLNACLEMLANEKLNICGSQVNWVPKIPLEERVQICLWMAFLLTFPGCKCHSFNIAVIS